MSAFFLAGDQFAKGFAFVAFAGRFGDSEELGDFATCMGGVPTQGIFLHFEGKAFAFLFTTADTSQSNKPFHGYDPEDNALFEPTE